MNGKGDSVISSYLLSGTTPTTCARRWLRPTRIRRPSGMVSGQSWRASVALITTTSGGTGSVARVEEPTGGETEANRRKIVSIHDGIGCRGIGLVRRDRGALRLDHVATKP